MKSIVAIYEQGVFRPTEPVDLPENSLVEFQPMVLGQQDDANHLDRVFEILSRRHDSGRHDIAARHNEHQP
jgi:predicted DNA-binding antitoxin AbrB/MazE fold protein